MASTATQRAYRAPCPGCGAPVEFASAQSTHAVCGFCQSAVVRQGETLARIGKMAELFDDHSPLQLQASGIWHGQAFTLVGQLQYKYAEGSWTEWYAVLADGSSAPHQTDALSTIKTVATNAKCVRDRTRFGRQKLGG